MSRVKKNSRFASVYMGIIFFLMYLPIGVVIVFSFNESKLPVSFTGFSTIWYEKLFRNHAMMEALRNNGVEVTMMVREKKSHHSSVVVVGSRVGNFLRFYSVSAGKIGVCPPKNGVCP